MSNPTRHSSARQQPRTVSAVSPAAVAGADEVAPVTLITGVTGAMVHRKTGRPVYVRRHQPLPDDVADGEIERLASQGCFGAYRGLATSPDDLIAREAVASSDRIRVTERRAGMPDPSGPVESAVHTLVTPVPSPLGPVQVGPISDLPETAIELPRGDEDAPPLTFDSGL